MYSSIPKGMTDLTLAIEKAVNAVLTNKYNPFYYHGALPQFYLWVLFLSGLLLFAYYIPTIDNAYFSENLVNAWTSVDYITDTLPYGAVVRAIHRYAGDAMVITIVLHALRVWITDRYRQYRWFQWVSGIVLFLMVMFIGQTGYYLVWDERSLILTRMTSTALEAIPFIGPGLKTWFLNGGAITNLTLSNFLFIHIGFSFSLLFGLWLHYVRMTRPVITPPPAINYMLVAVLLVFVFLVPVTSGKMADINTQPTSFEIDWFFLWPYYLLAHVDITTYWVLIIGGSVALCLIPLPSLYKAAHPVEPAEVVLNKCTGCSMCAADCPYQAIEMVPAPSGSRFKKLATVKAYRCSGCGVCVGACAFDAIDLPNLLDTDVTAKIKALAEAQ
ncbi:MAG: cytochrome b N-terminal domain-containing protein [Candidatus Melainabacteria bacterium]|jgi:quinol-cytochrome oxidoreductase complex cytochrome b subunit|uniref:Cytochrome b N-terminal domain-containing protein n=1 Tax=Candidatus Obscuribacter phosphatis TaxID=1906157 RepID=A0A8J7PGK9_9BACT|nr:cytochrome b N-terminal domain-containing protein [Candidatus Obscuribacter phosphatis]MCA0312980.1 cytochrome b N-terminal domain-containing protein [Candidatus Melainabacteria bacterium]